MIVEVATKKVCIGGRTCVVARPFLCDDRQKCSGDAPMIWPLTGPLRILGLPDTS